MMSRSIFAIVALCALASMSGPAFATGGYDDRRFSVGLGTGILGHELHGSYLVNDDLSIRANLNHASYEMPGWLALASNLAGIPYDYDLRLMTVGLLADYRLLGSARSGNGLILTGGLYYNGNRFDLVATPLAAATIGETLYTPADMGTLNAELKFKNAIAPYLGVGVETNLFTNINVTAFMRGGLLFQGPGDSSLTVSGAGVSPADLAIEESQMNTGLGFLQVMPVFSMGIKVIF